MQDRATHGPRPTSVPGAGLGEGCAILATYVGMVRARLFPILSALLCLLWPGQAAGADLMSFWDVRQRGGNSFNGAPPSTVYFRALRGYGATWVRLAPDKWKGAKRDFLIGDADRYDGIPPQDLRTLVATLDRAHGAGLKVVVVPLSLPGARWIQNNGGRYDGRLWQSHDHWEKAVAFWRDLAAALKDHPAVAAYNVVNEPTPERGGGLAEHSELETARRWYSEVRGTSRDIRAFYAKVVAAIREVDPHTPIMLDMGWYAAADGFYWDRLQDERVLYSFHMYEPYALTSAPNLRREPPLPYPGRAPGRGNWDRERVVDYLEKPRQWAQAQGLPSTRLVAGEFGCMRRLAHCPLYLEHVVAALEEQGYHWAFYAFREDVWDGMDYELGSGRPGARYWEAVERGDNDAVPRRPTDVFKPILEGLALNP